MKFEHPEEDIRLETGSYKTVSLTESSNESKEVFDNRIEIGTEIKDKGEREYKRIFFENYSKTPTLIWEECEENLGTVEGWNRCEIENRKKKIGKYDND